MDCKNCKNKPVFKDDVDKARLTRTIRSVAVLCGAIVLALIAALVAVVISTNNRWAATVERMNEKWVEYFNECEVYDYSYEQDGNGVNIIGNENGVASQQCCC